MKRTQIYLRESQKKDLKILAAQKNQPLAELIREAVDRYIAENRGKAAGELITAAEGIWKDRDDIDSLDYVRGLRRELDARLKEEK